MHRHLLALTIAVAPFAAHFVAACDNNRVSAAATKPMSPADGAGDHKSSPGGENLKPVVPESSNDPGATGGSSPAAADCPPKCNSDGAWSGCGLTKPRGGACQGCTPKCKGKGTKDEGWYDCSGVLIAQRACGT